MTAIHSLRDLLVDELSDLYDAETQLVKALPKMAKAAADDELKQGFQSHLEETKGHVERLERAFELLNAPARRKACHAMEGLVKEGAEAIEIHAPDAVRDADLVGAAQRVEHYEIAAYGTARSFAQALHEEEVARLLQSTLEEESATDKKLTAASEAINARALAPA